MKTLFKDLSDIIVDFDKFIIMTHKKPDLDAYGSALGLYEIISNLKKSTYIFLNEDDDFHSSVEEATNLVANIKYINQENYKDIIDDKTLLIIIDTHQKERVYYKEIFDNISNVVVLDHHIKNKDAISKCLYFYIDSKASSMAEIITEFSIYHHIKLSPLISTIMLAGLETDTNFYNLKITAKTYEMASVLMRYGADSILKQELLKETKENYLKRADYIKNSFMLNSYTAVCILDDDVINNEDLSSIAEEMLKFENVIVTFAIGTIDKNVLGISAKSIGNYDVCKIMKTFNGGGHTNNAAAQIKNGKIKDILSNLNKILEEQYEGNIN